MKGRPKSKELPHLIALMIMRFAIYAKPAFLLLISMPLRSRAAQQKPSHGVPSFHPDTSPVGIIWREEAGKKEEKSLIVAELMCFCLLWIVSSSPR